jgi:Protein of unknown function (DUF1571)
MQGSLMGAPPMIGMRGAQDRVAQNPLRATLAEAKPSSALEYDRYASQMQIGRSAALSSETVNESTTPAAVQPGSISAVRGDSAATPRVVLEAPVSDDESRSTAAATGAQPLPRTAQAAGPVNETAAIQALVIAGRARLSAMSNYQVRLTRQERVGSTLFPVEQVVLSIRRSPKAVRIEWPDGQNKGREALYSAEAGDGMLHMNMPGALVSRPVLRPDSPLVMSNSRHPISEAGLDAILENIERGLAASGQPNAGRFVNGGLERPADLGRPCHKIERVMPDGETWVVYLDSQTNLPAMVQANAANGNLLERYVFTDLKADVPELVAASAFDPDTRWGPAAGLIGRLARGNDSTNSPTASR